MKLIRTLHLYLGCIFAPLLVLFSLSGAWQVYRFNDGTKDGSYRPPQIVRVMSLIHTNQSLDPKGLSHQGKAILSKAIAATLGLALAFTTVLGIIMAYKFNRSKFAVTGCLIAGIVIPGLLIYLNM